MVGREIETDFLVSLGVYFGNENILESDRGGFYWQVSVLNAAGVP